MAETDSNFLVYGLMGIAVTIYLQRWLLPSKSALSHIPAIGFSAPILSYYTAALSLSNGHKMIREGYYKYKGGVFKVPELFRWHVIVSGSKLIDELRKAPDEFLSFDEANAELLSIDLTLGPEIHYNPYHIPIIRSALTRNLGAVFPDVREELQLAFEEAIPPTDDWIKVPASDALREIVCRTSNRIFVGLPLCRNKDYQDLNIQFAVAVILDAITLQLMPAFLRSFAGKHLTMLPRSIARATKHLEPVIMERLQRVEESGPDYEGKPNDMLSWLIDEAVGDERTVPDLVLRILTVNFAAIHTSSMTFTQALYALAAHPESLAPMREEVERVIKEEGWTKAAMQKMRKVDSFMKECQRYFGLGSVALTRKAMKDFTFSDGTFIPAGSIISAASVATHTNEEFYDDAQVFNPWRFSDMRSEEGEGTKHQMVSTSTEYIAFGHGRHACPGRFFAANELKGMMAHLVVTYDVKMEKEGVIPDPTWIATNCRPNDKAEVMFRRRQT